MYRALQALAAVLVLGTTTGVLAQTPAYPTKPIRLIVPYPAGGPLDTAARALAEQVRTTLGVIVVENRPGAGGNLGVDRSRNLLPMATRWSSARSPRMR